jgi:cysteinyl-tRNA synthetase
MLEKVVSALENDLNTSLAITHLNSLAKQIMVETDPQKLWELKVQLLAGMKLLGLEPKSIGGNGKSRP